jgi:GxxExxY protein
MHWKSQQRVPLHYKGLSLEAELRYDVLVEDLIIVELKSIDTIGPVHEAILLTYLGLLQKPKGIIINFNCENIFKSGQKTMVNRLYQALPTGHE